MEIVKVTWRDSRLYITQEQKDIDWEVCTLESVGYLIHEDDNHVVLAGDLVDDDVRRSIVIPRENITSKEVCK